VRPVYPVRILKEEGDNDRTITHLWAFEISLETSKISDEPIQQEVVVGSSKGSVDENACVDSGCQRIVGKWVGYIYKGLGSVVPSDPVGSWVYPDEVREPPCSDLNVVVGIAPATQSARFVIVEYCRVLRIGGVLYGIHQNVKHLSKVGECIPRVQSQYGVVPLYPHLSLNEFSKCLTR